MCPTALATLAALLQIAVPPPRGYVNDFAGVLDAASVAHMTAVITELREKTRGEVAVVTLADIADRPAADVALSFAGFARHRINGQAVGHRVAT